MLLEGSVRFIGFASIALGMFVLRVVETVHGLFSPNPYMVRRLSPW